VNEKFASVALVVPEGPDTIDVSGGVVSAVARLIVHVRVAGVGSVFPAASLARTSNVCEPSASAE
jgi:hypothetical protein